MFFSWNRNRRTKQQTKKRTATTPPKRPNPLLALEALEDRLAPATIFHVNTTDDSGSNTNPTAGSLRDAIIQVNAAKFDTIDFAPLGNGNVVVHVQDVALPTITRPVTITGVNQAVEVKGVNDGAHKLAFGSVGLTFGAGSDGSTVLGIKVDQFQSDGILLNNVAFVTIGGAAAGQAVTVLYNGLQNNNGGSGIHITGSQSHDDAVIGSYIGTDASDTGGIGNTVDGILIDGGAHNNQVGGLNANERNVISSNAYTGVQIENANSNTVAGNYIGTTADGLHANLNTLTRKPTQSYGVVIDGSSSNNTIGAEVATNVISAIESPANLISGNRSDGVYIFSQQDGPSPTGNKILGNFIGTDRMGIAALPNGMNGVELRHASGNWIGSAAAGDANVISGNGLDGIALRSYSSDNVIRFALVGTGPDRTAKNIRVGNGNNGIYFDPQSWSNVVRGSTIRNNGASGVEDDTTPLGNKVVDPNSISGNAYGIDNGTSAGAPVLNSAVVSADGLSTTVTGSLASAPDTTYVLEFFGNSVADPVGHEQGEFFLGNLTLTTDDGGNATFTVTLDSVFGVTVSATATDPSPDGDTSEFSNEVAVTGSPNSGAAVGGFVWQDVNGNGLQDAGEPGAAGVQVQLFDASNDFVAATTTDSAGDYLLTNVAAGQYYLQFTPPSGEMFTAPYQGDATLDSHADPISGDTELFSLSAGEVDPFYGAGLVDSATVQGQTGTSLSSSADPSNPGQAVTFTAIVSANDGGTPTGTVSFYDSSTLLGTATLDDTGTAIFTTSSLSVGSHPITAVYGGDANYAGSGSNPLMQIVGVTSSTSLTSSSDPSMVGQSVTLTAVVSGVEGDTPTGTVLFLDGDGLLGSATLDESGTATFTTSALAVGDHSITAIYTGDGAYAGSESMPLTQTVQLYPTSVNLQSSNSESSPGQSVTFTAYVSSDGGPYPTGTVSFYDGTTLIGTGTVAYGEATLTTSSLSVGTHSITAVYDGDAAHAASTSGPVTQTVQLAASTTYVQSGSGSSASPGQAVTFTATVSADGEPPMSGTVSFYDGSTLLGTVTLVNNAASFTTSSLPLGTHTITAVYSGDDDFNGSSGALNLTVQMAPTSTYLESSSQTASAGTPVTFTAYIYADSEGGPSPTGTVSFYDGSTLLGTGTVVNGVATFTTSSLAVGTHTITAVYGGDDANDGSTSQSLDQTID